MKQQSFEQAMQRLEKIVADLENGDTHLEDSIKLFEEGMNLAKLCMDKLNQAEKKLQKLTRDDTGSFQLELIP
jgi:exodeoxyribonuclease VII small subunit